MKRYFKLFLTLFLIISIIISFSSCFTIIRHMNPIEIEEEYLLPIGFSDFYSNIILLTIDKKYNSSFQELAKGVLIYIPENLRFIVSDFHFLLEEIVIELNQVENLTGNAEELLKEKKFDDSEKNIDQALLILHKTQERIDYLELSAMRLSESLGESPEQLFNRITELKNLADIYFKEIGDIRSQIEDNRILEPLRLNIQTDLEKVFLGTSIMVSGALLEFDGKSLPFKKIEIYFNDIKVKEVKTDWNGYYKSVIEIPYLYKGQVQVYSLFKPLNEDEGIYPITYSNILNIRLLYWSPNLIVDDIEYVFLGSDFQVSGKLLLEGRPITNHQVNIKGFFKNKTIKTDLEGNFESIITVPYELQEGSSHIIIEAPPKGFLGPALKILNIKIIRSEIEFTIFVPRIVLAGQKITFKGNIKGFNVPIENVIIKTNIGDISVSNRTDKNGFYNMDWRIPLRFYTRDYLYKISIPSQYSCDNSSCLEGKIFILNPLTPIVSLIIGILVIYRVRTEEKKKEISLKKKTMQFTPLVPFKSPLKSLLRGMSSVYWIAVRKISDETGVTMKASDTIRDYISGDLEKIKKIKKKEMKKRYYNFKILSLLFEKALYDKWFSLDDKEKALTAFRNLLGEDIDSNVYIFCIYCGERILLNRYCTRCGKTIEIG